MITLVHVTRGVWRTPGEVDDLRGVAAAILSAYPPGTVLAGLTAARLHGLWLPERQDLPIELIVHPEVAVPARRPGGERRKARARRQMVLPDEVDTRAGLPMTTPARTWLDLCDRLPLPDLVAAGDCVLRGEPSRDQLDLLVSRARHRRGVVHARAALGQLDPRSRSRPESHLRYTVVSAGLPPSGVNTPIYDERGGWLAEPDLSYSDVRLALEYDGALHAEPGRMRRDITRGVDVALRGGWRSVTFGPAEVFRRPDEVVALVRQLRFERRHLLR